jgi:hypothetical protein
VTDPAISPTGRQLPRDEEIFLDHVGHFVRDPQAASRALARAGFAPTPVSVQVDPAGNPAGTGNVCAMFTRGYAECLFKAADTPLGREFDAALGRYAGIQLAAFAVADAGKARERLGGAGFRVRPLAEFARPVATETGSASAAFTVARVEPGEMAEGRIQILTHHTEDAVWQKRWLVHPNGALALASIAFVVADVQEAGARFARFTGRAAEPASYGRTIVLDRGHVELVTPGAFAHALPDIAIPCAPFAGVCGITVTSLATTEAILRRADMQSRRLDRGLVVAFPEELGKGAWLFRESAEGSLFV